METKKKKKEKLELPASLLPLQSPAPEHLRTSLFPRPGLRRGFVRSHGGLRITMGAKGCTCPNKFCEQQWSSPSPHPPPEGFRKGKRMRRPATRAGRRGLCSVEAPEGLRGGSICCALTGATRLGDIEGDSSMLSAFQGCSPLCH